MNTDKEGLVVLVELFYQKGGRTVVISPGSRNAPVCRAFLNHPDIDCLSAVDERSAAFFALGICQATHEPVGLICTSGTALLNYAPAMAEAFYQKLPLLAFTADRPEQWIDQAEGQAIRQHGVFDNFCKSSVSIPTQPQTRDERWYVTRKINEAINAALSGDRGPVHINLPLTEPLYQQQKESLETPNNIKLAQARSELSTSEIEESTSLWNASSKKLILCGAIPENSGLQEVLNRLAERSDTVVLTETLSNLSGETLIGTIDRTLECLTEPEKAYPDLIISIGSQVVSKRIKGMLREAAPREHWTFSKEGNIVDTFQQLSRIYPVEPGSLLNLLADTPVVEDSDFHQIWHHAHVRGRKGHQSYMNHCVYSDLKVFEHVLKSIPASYHLQLGNSSVVRYAQLFEGHNARSQHANRGTSGIDGSASTAVGYAWGSKEPVLHISGDISFLYDSHSLWNQQLPGNFRIIVINNGGGGIFRYISGPQSMDGFEEYLETHHALNLKGIATTFGVEYQAAHSAEELADTLKEFYESGKGPRLLEIFTPRLENAEILKDYFNYLMKGKHE